MGLFISKHIYCQRQCFSWWTICLFMFPNPFILDDTMETRGEFTHTILLQTSRLAILGSHLNTAGFKWVSFQMISLLNLPLLFQLRFSFFLFFSKNTPSISYKILQMRVLYTNPCRDAIFPYYVDAHSFEHS